MSKYKCNACGEAENTDDSCTLETWAGVPECCPISGDDMDCGEWEEVKE